MGIKPLPTIREAFSEARREESRRKVMIMDNSSTTPAMEGSAFYTHISSQNQDHKLKKGRPWCENCEKLAHQKKHVGKYMGNQQIGSLTVRGMIERVVLMLLQHRMIKILLKAARLLRSSLMHCRNYLGRFLLLPKHLNQLHISTPAC